MTAIPAGPGRGAAGGPVHWADAVAAQAIGERGPKHVVATGITPSGPIHLGNLREMLTAHAIYLGLLSAGAEATLIYIADTLDPLRRVYPFLPQEYHRYIGHPLCAIPDPEGCCPSYAEHFLQPFLRSIEALGIRPKVYPAHEMYQLPEMRAAVVEALTKREEIVRILAEVTGRAPEEAADFYSVTCARCGRLAPAATTDRFPGGLGLRYRCACGHQGDSDLSQPGGKLSWRVDWAARWKALGVTVEPFGKDHATAGGSYDSGKRLAEEVFGYPAPVPLVYEWIYMKGQGPMAGSTGVGVTLEKILEILPPEMIRFLILRVRPEKHIDFDATRGLVQLDDEYHSVERIYYGVEIDENADRPTSRIYELSQAGEPAGALPLQVPLTHAATVVQMAGQDAARAGEILARSGYPVSETDLPQVSQVMARAQAWLDSFAPPVLRSSLAAAVPAEALALPEQEKSLFLRLAEDLSRVEWNPESIHNAVHQAGKSLDLPAARTFAACYLAFLGTPAGPRLGYLLASLDPEFVVNRLLQTASWPLAED